MIDNFDFGRIAIIGDLILDCYINGSVERISPEAPVPVLVRANHTTVPGGAANVAMNAATLGCQVSLVGLVGDDDSATALCNALKALPNINTDGIITDPTRPTITKTRVLSGRQQLVRIDDEKTSQVAESAQNALIVSARKAIQNADVVVCSDYAKGVLSPPVLQAIFAEAQSRAIPVIVDPKQLDFRAYRGATLLTPNRGELKASTNLPVKTDAEIEYAARNAIEQFGGDVLVTRSEDGMTLCSKDGRTTHARTHKSEVYDVSGAGDTVVATVASVLSANQDLETAIIIATNAASIAVGKLGTATVSRAELSQSLLADMQESGATLSLDRAQHVVENWRHHGARIVFTNGCFDLLHPGHVALLKDAAQQGDKLVVALNSDASVMRLKGPTRPLQDQAARATVMGALRYVDLVVIFDEDTPLQTIKALRPDIIVKGSDYTEDSVVGGDFVKSYGGSVYLSELISGRSTTSIVHKMAKK
ncbi:ADP-heptose synthase [Neokomagataea thailandica NBRC 106555]|uniref:Bifunctional protein HldE n=2 Tax=Neokomagataea TaxID=1223423 RepID=A0A4Y6V4R3_9PROT|nr:MULTISPECIES: D-glycero-beta-D-manno-heptose-7-phosphate kinase [Neokomagataea]QDH25102.1 D-glycero-beta-D-manno-heptose-7-phosphate kinase [Neokomagataea tanensis]GBR52150.1 ADP-heptose synthase [Neokomagataea thailandica NBRC 106555]